MNPVITDKRAKFNHQLLQLAREYRQMSQTDLAVSVRMTQAALSKIESGITEFISSDLLRDLSATLSFPQEFFLEDEQVTNMGSSALYNRGRKKLKASDMKWISAKINLLRRDVRRLLSGVQVNNERSIPTLPIEDEGSASSAARKVRAYWNLPAGPVNNVTELVESAGALIVPFDFGTRHLDGTCIWLADCPPLIFVNEGLPADRYRWTICHELAHLVLHTIPRETQEDEADEFAAEFLMPGSDIKPFFRRKVSVQYFASLKPVWGVAMASLARRCLDLRLMSERQYRYYIINIRKLGLPEPNQFPKESPSAWKELVEFKANRLGYSKEELERFLN
ncbi:unnamed protein product, partial [Discosporangium mesarthrocarpum]